MVKPRDKSIYKPEKIRIVHNEGTQKLNVRSDNGYDIDDVEGDLVDYYKLFRERKLICEALDCNTIASKQLEILMEFYGKQVFFFCKNCIEKFKEEK